MPRKPRNQENSVPEKMPFQLRIPEVQKSISLIGIEKAKMALPIFGGTSPEQTSENNGGATTTTQTQSSAGGDGKTEKKEFTPEQISDLVSQLEEATTKLTAAETENKKYKADEEKKAREALSKEEALTKDLETAQNTIMQMDNALRNQAIINAINGYEDIKFHSVDFAAANLSSDIRDNMVVDLEKGTVTITGIENELKRIAKENEWAVKAKVAPGQQQQNGNQPTSVTRGSGAPPAAPARPGSKSERRAELEQKWPVIARGRR